MGREQCEHFDNYVFYIRFLQAQTNQQARQTNPAKLGYIVVHIEQCFDVKLWRKFWTIYFFLFLFSKYFGHFTCCRVWMFIITIVFFFLQKSIIIGVISIRIVRGVEEGTSPYRSVTGESPNRGTHFNSPAVFTASASFSFRTESHRPITGAGWVLQKTLFSSQTPHNRFSVLVSRKPFQAYTRFSPMHRRARKPWLPSPLKPPEPRNLELCSKGFLKYYPGNRWQSSAWTLH